MIGSAQNALLQQQMALMAKNALGGVLNIPQRPLGRTMIAPPQPTTMVTPPSPDWLKGQTPGFAPDTTNYQLPGFTPSPPQDPNEDIRLKAILQQLFQKQQLENMFNPTGDTYSEGVFPSKPEGDKLGGMNKGEITQQQITDHMNKIFNDAPSYVREISGLGVTPESVSKDLGISVSKARTMLENGLAEGKYRKTPVKSTRKKYNANMADYDNPKTTTTKNYYTVK